MFAKLADLGFDALLFAFKHNGIISKPVKEEKTKAEPKKPTTKPAEKKTVEKKPAAKSAAKKTTEKK